MKNIDKIDDILAWLDGEGEFEYKGRKTIARFYSELEPKREGYIRIIDTTFIRDPFWIKANEEFVTVKESKVTETEEAKSIHVEDASTIGQLGVLGNQEQENRSGKNKLNLANIQQATKNGITCTYNKDGSVTFNGICTADNTSFVINNININAVKNQTIMSAFYEKGSISAQEEKTAYIYARINTSDYSKILDFNIADLNNSNPVISEQYKFDDALLNQFSFRIESGTILNKFTVKIMITDTPEEATEYEQYGATPSPEYPSKIVCLGSNKNLYDGTNKNYYINISANSCGISEGGTGSIVDVKGKSNVTISSSIAQTRFRAGCINSEVTGNTAVTLYNGLNKDNSIEMTINCEEYNYLVINATDLSKIKVEEGTEATSYSSFGQGSTLISKINKNIYDIAKYPFTNRIAYNSSGGQVYWDGYCGILDYFPIQENAQYTFSNSLNKPIYCGLVFYSEDKQVMSAISTNTTTFTTPENCKYIRFAIQSDTLPSWVQIELGNTATSNIEHKQTDYLLYIQQEMLKGDYFVKESDGWKEVHGWNKIESYNGESITTEYISTTGELTIGATIFYKTEQYKLPCTEEQIAVLEELNNLDLYKPVTNIITTEDIALLKLKYMKITDEKINNEGNVESRPILRLEKTSTESVELTINNCRFKYNFNDEEYVEIDCEQKEVKYEGLNRNRQIEIGYEFPILNVGDNDIKMHSGDCVIKVLRKDRWL